MANDRRDATRRDWPTMLGEFRILRQLAVGPYSTSLLVRMIGDPEKRGEMVLKVLHPVSGPTWKAAMRMDMAVVDVANDHPHANIARTYEKGQILDHVYVLQEYVDGIDLRSLLTLFPQPLGEFPLRARTGIAVQLAAALEHMHSVPFGDDKKGRLFHGDIHPGNVIVDRRGVVKLMDVGFADMALAAIQPAVTGSAVGSPGYLAPEQIANRRPTPSTDVFAYGSLVAEMFAGEPLFQGDTTVAILEHTRSAQIAATLDRIGAEHAGAARIVHKAVTPERKGRLSDGVLLVGEMFAAGMTDDAREVLAELVDAALSHRDEGIALPPRDLVASDGSLVDISRPAEAGEGLEEPDEPSHESEAPSVDPGYTPESVPAITPAPSSADDEEPSAEAEEPVADEPEPPPPVALEPDLEETEPEQPLPPPPEDEAAGAGKAAPSEAKSAKRPAAKAKDEKKGGGGKGLMIVGLAAIVLVVCGGGAAAAWFGFFASKFGTDPVERPFEEELAEALGVEGVSTGAETGAETGEATPAETEEEPTPGEEELTADGETDGLAEDEEATPEEPTPEPVELTPEEKRKLAEEEEERRKEREEKRKEREEERKRQEEADKFKSREEELEAAADDIDWGFAENAGEDEDWLDDDGGGSGSGSGDDKIDLDIDALTRDAPDVSVPDPDRVPPKVKHSPIRSGRAGQTVTLRLTVSPDDDYTGIMYYRGAPNGSWSSMDISGNSRITVRLKLGSWLADDQTKVEYYFLVDGPGGSSGAGTRLSPYSFEVR